VENFAFSQLIDILSTAPVLSYSDFNERFFLATYASSIGLGAMIYQLQDEIPRPVAFICHAFNTTELNWSIPGKELCALIGVVVCLITPCRCLPCRQVTSFGSPPRVVIFLAARCHRLSRLPVSSFLSPAGVVVCLAAPVAVCLAARCHRLPRRPV
jgi:RNase H-like domain found in reverse transcriptase